MAKRRKKKVTVFIGYEGDSERRFLDIYLDLHRYDDIVLTLDKLRQGTAKGKLKEAIEKGKSYNYFIIFIDEDIIVRERQENAVEQINRSKNGTCFVVKPICLEGSFLHCVKGFADGRAIELAVSKHKLLKKDANVSIGEKAKMLFKYEFRDKFLQVNLEEILPKTQVVRMCKSVQSFISKIEAVKQ